MPSETYTCITCFKDFSRRGDLTRHANIHAGYKPHKCNECGKCFSQYSGLKTHRNVHSKVKPFTCEIDGCKAAFGDPSSRARHCKETHRTVGTYRCPVARCKSSIKRRSAFTQHLKKHGIDPESIDIDALAPALIARQAPYQMQRKSLRTSQAQAVEAAANMEITMPFVAYHDGSFYHERQGPNGCTLQPVEKLTDGQGVPYAINGNWPQGVIELPVLPQAGAFTIDMPSQIPMLPTEGLLPFDLSSPMPSGDSYSPLSNPGLSYSTSPSPSPPEQSLLHPGLDTGYGVSSSPSTRAPSPLHDSSLLFFEPVYAAQNDHQKSMSDWNFDASLFGMPNERFNGLDV